MALVLLSLVQLLGARGASLVAPALAALPALIPDVSPRRPPGTDGLGDVLGVVAWVVIIVCVFTFLIAIGVIVWSSLAGVEQLQRYIPTLGIAMVGAVLVGGVTGFFTFVGVGS